MEQRLSLVTLGVADLERSAHFYETGLGWRRSSRDEGVIFFQTPGTIIGLYPRTALAEDVGIDPGGTGFGGVTLAYNARSREEVDMALAVAVAAGGTLMKPAEEAFWGGYSGYFADPDGHLWEVAFNPFWTIDEDGRVSLTLPE
jgi:catechol 2,3-dioxygenase-like lactoylglutathione lyase family enzyme